MRRNKWTKFAHPAPKGVHSQWSVLNRSDISTGSDGFGFFSEFMSLAFTMPPCRTQNAFNATFKEKSKSRWRLVCDSLEDWRCLLVSKRISSFNLHYPSLSRTQNAFNATFKEKSKSRWRLVCDSLEDWRCLAQRLRTSQQRCDQHLYRCIVDDFLPYLPNLLQHQVRCGKW